MILSLGINADDQEVEHTHESDFEEGCSNEIDDDLDGLIDDEDSDCDEDEAAYLLDLEDYDSADLKGILVWGVGLALLNSVGGDSGTGTATTD